MGPHVYQAGADALGLADESVGAAIITGAGAHFSSGGNLNRLRANRDGPRSNQRQSLQALHRWIQVIADVPFPVIAAVEGHAAGAGFSLALACDLIVASDKARFTLAYVKVGLTPDGGATAGLRSIPRQLALQWLLDAQPVTADRLFQIGLVNKLADEGSALMEAQAWADRLAAGPTHAQRRIKQLVRAAPHNDLASQLTLETDAMMESVFGSESAEGINAFLQKRPAVFTPSSNSEDS